MEVPAPATHCRWGGGLGTVRLFLLEKTLRKCILYKLLRSLTEGLKTSNKVKGADIGLVIFSDKSNTFPEKLVVLNTKTSRY